MRHVQGFIVLLGLLAAATAAAQTDSLPESYLDLLESIPDITQTAEDFAGGGEEFCAPAAVSNSFMQLSASAYPNLTADGEAQTDLVKRLASARYMRTGKTSGTSERGLIAGVRKFVRDAGYAIEAIEYHGLDLALDPAGPFTSQPASLHWLKSSLIASDAVWLRIGWYETREGRYVKQGGHWVTLVGYDRGSEPSADVLVISDPSPRAGLEPRHDRAACAVIESGMIEGFGRPQPAAGWVALVGGIALPENAALAIVEGAVRLKLAPTE